MHNIRENRKGDQKWTIQRRWQHWVRNSHTIRRQTKQKTQNRKLQKLAICQGPEKNGGEPMCLRRLMILTLTYTYLFLFIFLNAHNAKLH